MFEIRIHFFAGGIQQLYQHWFVGELEVSLDDISREVAKVIRSSFLSMLNQPGDKAP